jgi:putative glycosyltransferase (TIGR04372 family)|tara:strand:+ start:361 stop:1611 length:1251 start_codon:yes stop_codon:yes gene_type:complete
MHKNIFDKIIYLAVLIVSPFFLVFILFYRKKKIVRIWGLTSHRIGHFAGNTEMHICSKIDNNQKKFLDICYFKGEVSNEFLAKKWKEKLIIYPRQIVYPLHKLINVLSYYFIIFKEHVVFDISLHSRDYNNYIDKYKPVLNLNKNEINKGKSLLKKFGLEENDKFICFIVRDSAYLNKTFSNINWSYWNYRDYDIDNFIPAAEELTKLGYYVFRMGKISKKKIISKNEKIIDYSFSKYKSDFLDIFLGANCEFCLTTDIGYDQVPYIFRRPLASITDPISLMKLSSKKFLNIFSSYYSINENKKLSIEEIFKKKAAYFYDEKYLKDKGISLIKPDSEDIKDLALDMEKYVKNNFKLSLEDEILNDVFFNIYNKNVNSDNFINDIQSNYSLKVNKLHNLYYGKISPKFLSKKKFLIQ